mgnify:CR=1 FL=1
MTWGFRTSITSSSLLNVGNLSFITRVKTVSFRFRCSSARACPTGVAGVPGVPAAGELLTFLDDFGEGEAI